MTFSFDERGKPSEFENDAFQRELPRLSSNEFSSAVWCAAGSSRVALADPRLNSQSRLRVHLISQSRFRPGEMYLWDPVTGTNRRIAQSDEDALGPVFDVDQAPHERSFFNFKFIRRDDAGRFAVFEPDFANRWYLAEDGGEIWTHSGTPAIASSEPTTRTVTLHYRQEFDSPAQLHLWAENGDYVTDVDGTDDFDHPQCLHFFAQNLVYLAREFRIDAFRLDHTATIVHSAAWDSWSGSVRQLGSGGGWDFLHGLRHAVKSEVGRNCLLMAEHLPNEWSMTNYGGPMDAQWGDDFHDRLIDACRRQFGMSRLADAFKLSHTASDDWHKIVNYPESHDEVGNVRDRVAYVAGYGQGWRMSKIAAAATLLSRGIPLYFMGAESAEDKQFRFGSAETLDLDEYLAHDDRARIRAWWRELGRLRRDPRIQGPSPIDVRFAEDQILAFTRGQNGDYFVVLNFGGWSGYKSLSQMNLPGGNYRELWNSSWPAFAVHAEQEDERSNGGRDARLHGGNGLNIPDYGVVILQRV